MLACGEVAEVIQRTAQGDAGGGAAGQTPAVLAEVVGDHAQFLLGRKAATVGHVAGQVDSQVTVAEQLARVIQAGDIQDQPLGAGQAVAGLEAQALGAGVVQGFIELHTAEAIDPAERPVGGAQAIDAALAAAEAAGIEAEHAGASVLQLPGLVIQMPGAEAEGLAAEFKNAVLVIQLVGDRQRAAGAFHRPQLATRAVVEVAAIEGQALVGLNQAALVGQLGTRGQAELIAADLAVGAVVQGGAGDGDVLLAEQFAAPVGQGLDRQLQVALQGGQRAGLGAVLAVVDAVGCHRQAIALHGAALVVQGAQRQVDRRATAEDHALAIAQVLTAVAHALIAGQELALVVVEGLRRDIQALAPQGAALVVEGGQGLDQHTAFGGVDHTVGVGQQVADVEGDVAVIADQRALAAVVEVLRGDSEGLAQQDPGAVAQALAGQQQVTLTLNTALGVEQLVVQHHAHTRHTTGQQPGTAVVEAAGADVQLVTDDTPGAVVDLPASRIQQQLLADDGAALVIQARGVQFDVALGGLQVTFGVVQLLGDGQGQLAGIRAEYTCVVVAEAADGSGELPTHQLAVLVGDVTGAQVQVSASLGMTLAVVEGVGDGEVERAFLGTDQALGTVVEAGGVDRHGVGNQETVLVVDRVRCHTEVARDNLPAGVIQRAAVERQAAARDLDMALAVIQRIGLQRCRLIGTEANQPAEVDDGRRVDRQRLLAIHPRGGALVGQSGTVQRDGFTLDHCALVVQFPGGRGAQRAAGQDVAAGVQGLRIHHHIAGGIAAVIGLHACFDDARVGDGGGVEFDALASGQALLVDQFFSTAHLHIAGGVDLVGQVHVLRGDLEVTGGRRLRHAQAPVGIQLDIAATGGQRTVEFHPYAGLGAHQFDRTGVHAAQCRGIDGQLGLCAAVIGARGGFQAVGIDVVTPGNDGQFSCVDLRIDLGRAGDDFEAVDVAGIQAFAVDGHGAAVNLVALQLAAGVEHRFAGGEGHVGGVDKAATAARDAVRVGDDDLGRLARHFGVAAQLAGAAAVDFVEDDAGRAALEVGVADDVATQLGVRHGAVGVVEDHAVGADVVVLELVMGQATAIGGGDVHHRYAIAGLADGGARRTDHNASGLSQQRLPEQRVGQDQHQTALGQAEERVSRFQRSRRLAGQEGKVANIHCHILDVTGR